MIHHNRSEKETLRREQYRKKVRAGEDKRHKPNSLLRFIRREAWSWMNAKQILHFVLPFYAFLWRAYFSVGAVVANAGSAALCSTGIYPVTFQLKRIPFSSP